MAGTLITIISGSAFGAFLPSYLDRKLKKNEQLRVDDKQEINNIEELIDQIIDQIIEISQTSNLANQNIKTVSLLNKLNSKIKILMQRDFNKKVGELFIKFKKKADVFDAHNSQDKEKDIEEVYEIKNEIMESIEDDYQCLHTRPFWKKVALYFDKIDKRKIFSKKIKLWSATLTAITCTLISVYATYYITNKQHQKDRLEGVESKRISIIERTENIFINGPLAKDNFVNRSITIDLLKEQKQKHLLDDDKIYEIADRIMNYNKEILKFDSEISAIKALSSMYFCNNIENKFEELSKNGELWWSNSNQRLRSEILNEMRIQIQTIQECRKK